MLQYNDGLTQFYADYDIKDCIDYISKAWDNVTPQNIRNSWIKILNGQFEFDDIKTENSTVTDEQNAEQSIDVMSAEEITEWISGCEQAEIIPEETATLKQICKFESSPSLIEDEEIDRLLYNLRMLSKIEPEIEADAKRIIDHFNKKQEK